MTEIPASAASAQGPPAARRPRLWTLLRAAVSVLLIAWVLRRAPVREVLDAFRSADPRFVLLALGLIPFGWWASVSRWHLLLRSQGGDASFGFLVRSFMTGVFFNNLLPSTLGGDAVRAWDTSRCGVSRATALAIIVVDRFIGLLALLLFAGVGLLLSGRLTDEVPALAGWVAGGALVLGLAAALLFLPTRRGPELLSALSARLPGRAGRLFDKAAGALFAFRGRGRVLAAAFGWSLFLQGLVVVNGWLLARALGVPIPLPTFFLIVPLAVFVMMVPVSVNAIGVRENVLAFFFGAFGVAAARAVAVAWLDYGLLLLQALAGGAVYLQGRRSLPSPAAARTLPAAEPEGAAR